MPMNYFSNHCYKDHLCNVYSQSSKMHLLHNDHFFITLRLPLLVQTMVSLILIKKINFSIPCFMLVGGERMSGEEFCLFIVCTGCKNKPHVPRNAKLAPPLQCIAPLFLSSLSSLHLLNTHIGAALRALMELCPSRGIGIKILVDKTILLVKL